MIIRRGVLILLATAVLSACQTLPEEPTMHAEPLSNRYSCGLLSVQFQVEEDRAMLELGDLSIIMTSVVSASGTRFQSQDGRSEFWQRGSVARLVVDDLSWPECTIAGSVPPMLEARGNEPFWMLKLTDDRAVLNRLGFDQEEEGRALERTSDGSSGEAVLNIGSAQEQLRVDYRLCQDSMTGMPYPYTIQLSRQGQWLNGCGGKPYDLLQGPQWQVTSLHGRDVPDDIELSLHFSEDRRVSGKAACNRFAGSVRLSGEGLDLGNLISTRMACIGELMEWEHSFLSVLAQVSRFSLTEDGRLVLFVGDTPVMISRL